MPETSAAKQAEVHHPATVGSTFMRQYYHLLAKEPGSLHRFYKDESTWCHGVGSHMQEAISGQKAINDEILRRGYAGARVDLDIGSIDCQPSLHGGVFVLVTGVMTLASSPLPKPFVQTFFLAVQPKGYFVLNDCLRFLELPPAADAAVAPKDAKKQPTHAAIGTPVEPTKAAKPATPVTKKDKPTPASPKPVPKETPVSPIKVKSPVKVASPKATAPTPAAAPAPASPVKKAAPAEAKTTPKPSETKPATPASPPAKAAAAAPAAATATPASPAVPKAAPAAPAKPAEPAAPPAPKTWAALFSGAPAAPAAPAAPKLAAVATTAVAAAQATPASPAKATADAAAAAAPKEAAAAAPAAASQEKEKKRLYSLYIRDVPPQTKESDLRELFKSYGAIASVGVPAGRGIAFVDYREEESMRAALADDKEFKVHDKVLHVEERKDKEQRGGFRADSRGGRGGRGAPKSGRSGERKDREDGKERRVEAGASANGKAPASTNGPRAPNTGDRREKGGRRSGKEDGGRGKAE